MKFENIDEANELVTKIKKENEKIEDFESGSISVKILRDSNYSVATIGIFQGSEHTEKDLAEHFVSSLISRSKQKRDEWLRQLEML